MSSENKPPKYLSIGGQKVKIVVKEDLECDGNEVYGLFTSRKHLIELNKDNDPTEQVTTLLHEAVHAALYISGVGEMLDAKLEEAVCRAVELIAPNIYFKARK